MLNSQLLLTDNFIISIIKKNNSDDKSETLEMDREIGIPAFELREGADLLFLFPGNERIGGMTGWN